MANRSYRIRTDAYATDKQINVKLDQHYDQFNVLSLTIKPADQWMNRCSDFGVVIGRVTANKGFGVPNAKVSIFIPLTAEDSYNPDIVDRYPYKTPTDKRNGVRYNLLPSKKQFATHTPVGTFPTKEEILRDDLWLEIYQKYYRFTTRTNEAGDFMFYGVPVGTYIIHYDVDISDIGDSSVLPFELIAQGQSEQLFDGPYKFKSSTDLDSLIQIVSTDKTINVQPFWGSKELCDVQITRSDFDLSSKGITLKSYALFIGSSVTDSDRNLINQKCKVKKHVGEQTQLKTLPGKIEILTLTDTDGDNIPDTVEFLNTYDAKIDENGVWAFLVELNGQKVIKDEFGNEVPSQNSSEGVVKSGFFRFKMSIGPDTNEQIRNQAKYIVPNNGKHKYAYLFNTNDVIYQDDNGTEYTIPGFDTIGDIDNNGVDSQGYYQCGPLFREFQRKKIYTIRNYIPRYSKADDTNNVDRSSKFLGFKETDLNRAKTPIPYNRLDSSTGIIYSLICIFYSALFAIVAAINHIISAINSIFQAINNAINAIVSPIQAILCPFDNGYLHTFLGDIFFWCRIINVPQINYINYISYECCTECDDDTTCNCYIPYFDCYSQTEICNGSSNGLNRTLKRCKDDKYDKCHNKCEQQQQDPAPDDLTTTQYGCWNNNGACGNWGNNIGDAGYTNHVYSFCTDSLKQCKLAEYVCESEEIKYEFYNAWITGLLYFPQIRYKERINVNGELKRSKFCDADWDSSSGQQATHPFRNPAHGASISDRDIFQSVGEATAIVDAGLIKYWPRQGVPPLGKNGYGGAVNTNHDYLKLPYDDIYYNARQAKRVLGFNSAISSYDTTHGNILLATEIMSLGTYLIDGDEDNAPFFIGQVPATTYKVPESLTSFLCFSCGRIVPYAGSDRLNLYEKICEFGTDFNDDDNPLTSPAGASYDLYVDESYLSGRTHIITNNTVNDINDVTHVLQYSDHPFQNNPSLSYKLFGYEGTLPDVDYVYVNHYPLWITRFNNVSDKYIKAQANPFYMYFGLYPGKTAIDVIHNNFIPKKICS